MQTTNKEEEIFLKSDIKILCVFPVFMPNEYFYQRGMDSIKSFVEYVNSCPPQNLDIIYGGWFQEDSYFEVVKEYLKTNLPSAKLFRFDKNYGKAFFVNSMISDYHIDNKDTMFCFSCDNDIKFIPTEKFFFGRLVLAAQNLEQQHKAPVGLIALNQTEENCHWIDKMKPILDYTINPFGINEIFVRTQDGQGIAGGAIFFNLKAFISFGGYRKFVSAYCGDDAFLELDFRSRGMITCVIKTLNVIHPKTEKNEAYIEWKKKVIGDWNIPFDEELFMKNVEESMNFWKNNK